MIGTEVLPEILAAFREQHPRIDVELVLSNRSQDLLRREADIAVRMVKPTQGALTARKLGVVPDGKIVPPLGSLSSLPAFLSPTREIGTLEHED